MAPSKNHTNYTRQLYTHHLSVAFSFTITGLNTKEGNKTISLRKD